MWHCTQLGFFSIVRKETDTFHIRARSREDLISTSSPRRQVQTLRNSIDCGNFKSVIGSSPQQRSKLAAYHDIHQRMVEWQDEHPPS